MQEHNDEICEEEKHELKQRRNKTLKNLKDYKQKNNALLLLL